MTPPVVMAVVGKARLRHRDAIGLLHVGGAHSLNDLSIVTEDEEHVEIGIVDAAASVLDEDVLRVPKEIIDGNDVKMTSLIRTAVAKRDQSIMCWNLGDTIALAGPTAAWYPAIRRCRA